MYVFPQIRRLPAKAVADSEAERRKITPDLRLFYYLELLENTGVVVVPVH